MASTSLIFSKSILFTSTTLFKLLPDKFKILFSSGETSTCCSSTFTGSGTLSTGTGMLLTELLELFNFWTAITKSMANKRALIGSTRHTTQIATIITTRTTLLFKNTNILFGITGVSTINNTSNPKTTKFTFLFLSIILE